MICAELFNAQ